MSQPTPSITPPQWNPYIDMTAQQMADLKALLNQAEVNPYTTNSGGGWGWRKGLSAYECELIFMAWHYLLDIYNAQFAAPKQIAVTGSEKVV